jgi:hypothetical protein
MLRLAAALPIGNGSFQTLYLGRFKLYIWVVSNSIFGSFQTLYLGRSSDAGASEITLYLGRSSADLQPLGCQIYIKTSHCLMGKPASRNIEFNYLFFDKYFWSII